MIADFPLKLFDVRVSQQKTSTSSVQTVWLDTSE